MTGLLLLVVLAVYMVITIAATALLIEGANLLKVGKSAQMVIGQLSVILFVLLPIGLQLSLQHRFRQACQKDSSLIINKVISDTEGFYYEGSDNEIMAILHKGYKFIEKSSPKGMYFRYYLDAQGRLEKEAISHPLSKYAIKSYTARLAWNIQQENFMIEELATGQQVAALSQVSFYYFGFIKKKGLREIEGYSWHCPEGGLFLLLKIPGS